MFTKGDKVKDNDQPHIGTIETIDLVENQTPNSWALVNFPTCPDPVGSQWIQLKHLKRVD